MTARQHHAHWELKTDFLLLRMSSFTATVPPVHQQKLLCRCSRFIHGRSKVHLSSSFLIQQPHIASQEKNMKTEQIKMETSSVHLCFSVPVTLPQLILIYSPQLTSALQGSKSCICIDVWNRTPPANLSSLSSGTKLSLASKGKITLSNTCCSVRSILH